MGKECGMHGSEGNLEQICDGKIGRKGSIQKGLWIWEENIAVDFKELYQGGFWLFMFWESVEWHSDELCNEL